MSQWFQWIILTSITGSPLLSIAILVVIWWSVDRFTLGILPNPVRALMRWRRMSRVQRQLLVNPHDRRARLELADLYLGQRRSKAALDVLKPNLEAGDDDPTTLYLMGLACFGLGHPDQGEVFFNELEERQPNFRLGAVDLERGRWRLARGDAAGARQALERLCDLRKGSVEGRLLLSRAIALGGDDGAAALMREEAWREYLGAPRFQRRRERFWAWRAKPSRPLLYAAVALILGLAFARWGAPAVASATHRDRPMAADTGD